MIVTAIMLAGECSNPMALVNNNVRIIGYEDPALEGEVISFTCSFGMELNGPISSSCIRNGEWDPNPGVVNCTGVLNQITTGTSTILHMPRKFCVITSPVAIYFFAVIR